MKTISEQNRQMFIDKVNEIKASRVQNYSQEEIALFSGYSRRTIIDFENGKILDYVLLCKYATINGIKINLK